MRFIADLHLHSKYSRATSSNMDLDHLDRFARIKGIKILGTGDFTHPAWFKELKEKLEPAEPGLFRLKIYPVKSRKAGTQHFSKSAGLFNGVKDLRFKNTETRFILTSEVSCIYSKGGSVRKIHLIIFAPSFETAEKINVQLGWIGNLAADGRPILGLDARELAKIVLEASEDSLVVPAHCLLPDTFLHSNPRIKKIKDISVGDKVYTHKGRFKKVKKTYKRPYKGKIFNIKPYYFRMGMKTTPEHPFYGIKTGWCPNMGHTICKKDCAYIRRRNCRQEYFKNYKPQWIQAGELEKGDVLIFPRFNNHIKDVKEINLNRYLTKNSYKLTRNFVKPANGTRANYIPNTIRINKEFCRLVGYYLSEGYTNSRDSVSFCFNEDEKRCIKDVKKLMAKIFHLSYCRDYKRKGRKSRELIFFSKLLAQVFSKTFYTHPTVKRAHTKCLPSWMLNLPLEKQVEIFKGWWLGDSGATSSRELMNQMKIISLRLGIIPSIRLFQTKESFNKKEHRIEDRLIKANHSQFQFSNLAFFDDNFNLLKEHYFKRFNTKLTRRHGWIDENYIYIPVRDIKIENYKGEVYNLEVEKDNSYLSEFAAVHNCWTPWFSLFGSKSGFDSIEECFEEYSKYIYAGETGLSANPKMFWRISSLDKITLISNSDSHSPQKIGREANVFEGEALDYKSIIQAIKKGGRASPNLTKKGGRASSNLRLIYTIEFFPEEGKYHYDGHRNCGISLSPQESKKYNNVCPRCGRPLTIGVLNRVEELADRPEDAKPEGAVPFKSLVPLEEIIAEALSRGTGTKQVKIEYENLIKKIGPELKILLEVSREDLEAATLPEIAEGIIRVRQGRVIKEPGYDGVYGKIRIFSEKEKSAPTKQKTLF